jgi:thymidylate synthase ThyX
MEVTFPRIVLAEFNTHRMFSRNSASSRAIPVEKRIAMVESDPFIPEAFGRNQKGMQASENLDGADAYDARYAWSSAKNEAVRWARELAKVGVHKQIANRLIEPFCWQTVIVSSTEWDNYFALRCNPDAQPEIRKVSELMRDAYTASTPRELKSGQWHTPFVDADEAAQILEEERRLGLTTANNNVVEYVSVGRCARVSYLTHDGRRDWKADVELAQRLLQSGHMSPFEHVARPLTLDDIAHRGLSSYRPFVGNFCGWMQLRKQLPNEDNFAKVLKVR